MAQIDTYLSRILSQNELSYQEDLLELYAFIPNQNLQILLAIYHTQLNKWFATLNGDINQ